MSTHADLVLAGGPVHLGNAARSRATAVAVKGDRIVAVGHDEVRELVGPSTEVVDLAGRLLVPGFQDAHVHPVGAGVELGQCDLTGTVDVEEYRRRIATYAAAHPDRPWITGGGWSMESFPGGAPDRAFLDAIVADRPVYLANRDHHGALANSRALELAGIDASTPDPADGRIERDAAGVPTGMLQEGAMHLVAAVVPETTREERLAGLLRAQEVLHSLGITAWQDALVGRNPVVSDASQAYGDAIDAGLLTARVVGALWWSRDRGAEQIEDLLAARDALTRGRFRATSIKIMQDGIAENHTAAMINPYGAGCGCSNPGDHRGLSFVDPEALKEHVTALDAHGFQVHFHALGDRAVREALDAIEVARDKNGFTDGRHHLAHLQVVHPEDVARFRTLGASANIQPLWAAHEPQMDELTIPFLGPERSAWQYPFGSLLRSGAVLAAGSDWPVSSADPILGIHVAVNRVQPDTDGPVFYAEERIDLGSALAAYTSGTAHVNHLDDTGAIAVGNLADLAVLDRDPFDGPIEDIWDTHVEQTFVGGERVFAR
ncbi:MAG TPA: amidohydrolase [Nocardioides sp.]|nr:amidohydrolase [Nocardioides sp.]